GGARRGGRAPRVSAHALRLGRGQARAADRPALAAAPAVRGPGRPAARRGGARGGTPRRGGVDLPLRRRARAPPALAPPAPQGGGLRPSPDPPPHHLGRLVDARPGARAAGALWGRAGRPALAPPRAAHPVPRLRHLAAR